MIRPELFEELQQIIQEEYGIELSQNDSADLGNSLVDYFGILANNHHKLHNNKYENKTNTTTGR